MLTDLEKALELKKSKSFGVKSIEQPDFFIKDISTSQSIVTGFYNTFNFIDSDADVLVSGSANKTILENGPNSQAVAKIKHALNHDLSLLPGKIKVLEERTFKHKGMTVPGIYFETKMGSSTLGQDTLKNYLDGIYDNHSIGFRYKQIEFLEKGSATWDLVLLSLINPEVAEELGYLFLVKEIELFEGSTVAFGANKLTPYLGAKSQNKEAMVIGLNNRLDKLVKAHSNGTQTDDTLKTFAINILQIKQMIHELVSESSPKVIAPKKADEIIVESKKSLTELFINSTI
jgi:hypothetical protein